MLMGPFQPGKKRTGDESKKTEIQNPAKIWPIGLCLHAFQNVYDFRPCKQPLTRYAAGVPHGNPQHWRFVSTAFFRFIQVARYVYLSMQSDNGSVVGRVWHEQRRKILVYCSYPLKWAAIRLSTDDPFLAAEKPA